MRSREWETLSQPQKDAITANQTAFPVKVGTIAQALGLSVKSATLGAGISGEIKCEEDTYIIRVNRHDVKARQRFTVAHEISHFLLHRELIGDGIVDDVLYRSNLSNLQEAQANRLAADIVMPWHLIEDWIKKNHHIKGDARIEKLAETAEVSTTAMQIRLEGRG